MPYAWINRKCRQEKVICVSFFYSFLAKLIIKKGLCVFHCVSELYNLKQFFIFNSGIFFV